MRVSNLMSRNVHACQAVDTLNRVAQILWEHDIGCVPILDNERRVIGIVTDRDVAMAAYTQGKPLGQIQVSTCMSRRVQSVREDDRIQIAASKMREHRVRRLAVVDEHGKLTGMLSLSDLSRRMWPRGGAKSFDDDELLSVVASVSQPRRGSAEEPLAALPDAGKPTRTKVNVTVRPMKRVAKPAK